MDKLEGGFMKEKISVVINGIVEYECSEMLDALKYAHENGIGKKVTFKIEKVNQC